MVLKLEHVSQSTIGLVKTKTAGLQLRVSDSVHLRGAQKFAHFNNFPDNKNTIGTETTLGEQLL